MITVKTPRELGYKMPAEWSKHKATWISWPNPRLPYWGKRLAGVEEMYLQILAGLQESEKVRLQVYDLEMERHILKRVRQRKLDPQNLEFYEVKNLDVWTRDHGPIFVKRETDGNVAITHWMFNGWGRYNDLSQDSSVPARIHEITGMDYFNAGMVLEGGSIEVDGEGALLTTKQCFYNRNRNPYTQDLVEQKLREYLGVEKIIWLEKGLYKDDTSGHIDILARFVGANTIACATEEDKADKNYRILKRNRQQLQQSGWETVDIPMPEAVELDGERRAASYMNFYIGNNVVLVPTYGQKKRDSLAVGKLKELFPRRMVIGINCLDIVASGGAIHCITQQQPARE